MSASYCQSACRAATDHEIGATTFLVRIPIAGGVAATIGLGEDSSVLQIIATETLRVVFQTCDRKALRSTECNTPIHCGIIGILRQDSSVCIIHKTAVICPISRIPGRQWCS